MQRKQSAASLRSVSLYSVPRFNLGCLLAGAAMFAGQMILPAAASADALVDALSNRHTVPSFVELQSVAGGKDALIARLLELRSDNTVPMLGMRSAKILLENFNGEEEIAAAFEEDLGRDDRKGIAQAIALNLDRVPSAAARMRLAKGVLAKAKADSGYAVYAKSLTTSKDEAVRSLAKSALP